MTTPESLEVMLISSMIDKTTLFANLRFVVVDEIHHFAADDRGAHLVAILERLAQYTDQDIQRIGLSATVGNPETISDWLNGSSQRKSIIIDPLREESPRLIRIDYYQNEEELADKVSPLARSRKTLFFVEGRKLAEGVKQAIEGATSITYVHHSSIGRELREEAEQSFTFGHGSQCIVCTSTMELGIDVGDLDAILQQDAPGTVSSFMQRMGRTGRRPGTRAEMNFFCRDEIALLRAIALVQLARRGWIEPVKPAKYAIQVLAHQILAQALQFYGIRRDDFWKVAKATRCFSGIAREDYDLLLDHLVNIDILNCVDSLYVFGKTGEKQFGRQNFLSMYSVFETPEEIKVLTTNRHVIGTLQAWFVKLMSGKGEMIFILAGQAWLAKHIDLDMGEMIVTPAPRGAIPRWNSSGVLIGRVISEEMRACLASEEAYTFLTLKAQKVLDKMRHEWSGIVTGEDIPLCPHGREWELFTFAGDRINILLGQALESILGCGISGDSLSLRIKSTSATPLNVDVIIQAIDLMRTDDYFSPERIISLAEGLPPSHWSKFQPLLPKKLEARFLAEKLFDTQGLQDWLKDRQKVRLYKVESEK
jgi:ATP-dependent Lhr-like helicase